MRGILDDHWNIGTCIGALLNLSGYSSRFGRDGLFYIHSSYIGCVVFVLFLDEKLDIRFFLNGGDWGIEYLYALGFGSVLFLFRISMFHFSVSSLFRRPANSFMVVIFWIHCASFIFLS